MSRDGARTGADLLVAECPGCVTQLRGGAVQRNMGIEGLHIFELLDRARV